jgi:hypothetical protein
MSTPHVYMGIPEAEKVRRLCAEVSPAALAELNYLAVQSGICTPADDAQTVTLRMKAAAEDTIRLYGK